MIEIEAKFLPSDVDMDVLLSGAQLVSEKTHRDVYYDTNDYELMKKDWWIRQRNGFWEFKKSLQQEQNIFSYEEFEDPEDIERELGMNVSVDEIELSFSIIFDLTSHRKKYTKEGVSIDIDTVTTPDGFHYVIGEIEILSTDEESARNHLRSFMKTYGIQEKQVFGKGFEYARQKNPEMWDIIRKNYSIQE